MKKAYLLCLYFILAFGGEAEAHHIKGAELYYKYIGDSTGIAYQYEVEFILYQKDLPSAIIPSTIPIEISSACGSSSVDLKRVYDVDYGTTRYNCYKRTGPPITANNDIRLYRYIDTIILPGKCLYTFSWEQCCREGTSTLQYSNSWGLYLESTLDNRYGPNSSPRFIYRSPRNFCRGNFARWDQHTIEQDGDSLHYSFAHPRADDTTFIPFNTGYSATQPLSTSTGIYLNSTNGNMTFTPSQIANGVAKILVEEYRKDANSSWKLIGTIERDIPFDVARQCNMAPATPVLKVTNTIDTDSIPEVACYTKTIRVKSSTGIQCNSIHISDFAVSSKYHSSVPVMSVLPDTCTNDFTYAMLLELQDSLYYDDTLTIEIRQGSDSTTLITDCEREIEAGDSIQVMVECGTGFGIGKYEPKNFKLFPNPGTDKVEVHFGQEAANRRLEVLNIQGIIVKEVDASAPRTSIEIWNLAPGLYFVRNSEDDTSVKFRKL